MRLFIVCAGFIHEWHALQNLKITAVLHLPENTMKVKKSQALCLYQTIDQWIAESVITEDDGDKLKKSIEITRFDYKRLAKYSFWFAIACFIISAGAFVLSPVFKTIIHFIEQLFRFVNPRLAAAVLLSLPAAGLYTWGLRRRKTSPHTIYKNEALFFLGALFTAGSIVSLCTLLEDKDISPVFLVIAIIYSVLGFYFPSGLIWILALICAGSWFGCETGYVSDWGEYFFGMNYPLRFIPFSACIIALAFFFRSGHLSNKYQPFFKPTYIIGLLYLFMALWILSMWGQNLGSILFWSVVFGITALVSIMYGLKYDDRIARGFGITFILINLYTKYFEYFWDVSNKAIFFFILGLSFWFIGSRAEKLWLFISKNTQGPSIEKRQS